MILSRRRQNAESEPADKDFQFFGNGVDRELRSIQFALGPIYPPWQYGVGPPLSEPGKKNCKKKILKIQQKHKQLEIWSREKRSMAFQNSSLAARLHMNGKFWLNFSIFDLDR